MSMKEDGSKDSICWFTFTLLSDNLNKVANNFNATIALKVRINKLCMKF